MRIPLFDIDSTLLKRGNPAHEGAFDYALHTVYQLPSASKKEIQTSGKIDTQILLDVLVLHGISVESGKEKMPQALKAMEEYYFAHQQEGQSIVLKGVEELLDELSKRKVLIGLLTGNVESIAWDKLEKAGIKHFFSFGSFGNMAYKRSDLIPIARQRAENAANQTFPLEDFFIVGDSKLDILCAKEGGIQVVAVAQGKYTTDELQITGADLVLDSLEEKEQFLKFIQ